MAAECVCAFTATNHQGGTIRTGSSQPVTFSIKYDYRLETIINFKYWSVFKYKKCGRGFSFSFFLGKSGMLRWLQVIFCFKVHNTHQESRFFDFWVCLVFLFCFFPPICALDSLHQKGWIERKAEERAGAAHKLLWRRREKIKSRRRSRCTGRSRARAFSRCLLPLVASTRMKTGRAWAGSAAVAIATTSLWASHPHPVSWSWSWMLDAGCVQQANRGLKGGGAARLCCSQKTRSRVGGKEEEEGLWWWTGGLPLPRRHILLTC